MDRTGIGPAYLADADVGEDLDAELRSLLSRSFSDPCFASRRFCHEMPAHRWIVRDRSGILAAHLAAHEKTIGTSAGDLRIMGIAEVCVHAGFRGLGLVRRMLCDAHEWAELREIPFAMLFGLDSIYRSSGYVCIVNPIRRRDPSGLGWVTSVMNSAMVRGLHAHPPWPPGEVDLRGPVF